MRSVERDKKEFIKAIVIVLLLVGLFVWMFIDNESSKQENLQQHQAVIKEFTNNATFICSAWVFRGSMDYLVSKKSGWEIYGESFHKGDLLIKMSECKNVRNSIEEKQ